MGHAPRERVSWNVVFDFAINRFRVTLHVSVWVEIQCYFKEAYPDEVTLHVSVWVEIYNINVHIH